VALVVVVRADATRTGLPVVVLVTLEVTHPQKESVAETLSGTSITGLIIVEPVVAVVERLAIQAT
jgi:hypothetical protein